VADLVDALAAHSEDPYARALALDAALGAHVAPWYADQAVGDAAALAVLRHMVLGAPAPPPDDIEDRVTFGQLRVAARVDAVAFRAVWRIMGMVGHPSDTYTDPALVARVRSVLAAGPPPPMAQPTRAELEKALKIDR
jgi:hypothetical protein